MFQTFEATTSPDQGPPRLADLRKQMATNGLDGFLIPRADAHQGEYVAARDARLSWLTGFTGSAGFCAALKNVAGVFIDGRYRLQVKDQVDEVFTPVDWPEVQLADWLKEQLPQGGIVGFDPWLHTVSAVRQLTKALAGTGIEMKPTSNLVDAIWPDQPNPPTAMFTTYPLKFAGETHQSKRERLAKELSAPTVITLPDSIAWLLNIRGTDIERNPVPHAFAILNPDASVDLFVHGDKTQNITDHIGEDVRTHAQSSFLDHIAGLTGELILDPKWCPSIIATTAVQAGLTIHHQDDPCLLPKACKNEAEIIGAKDAHLRDGAAMVRFLAWLDAEAPKGQLTEIDVVKQLEQFRRETNQLLDVSFETISGAGANGAIVHYRVTDETNRPVRLNELLLVDSGGQYIDGTTDITRTIIIGTPSDLHRSCFTRVLQGMIAISRARFPRGVQGQHLDSLARFPLWTAGLDYDHGTGHGIGSYLCVHEGPQSLSRRSDVELSEGMILSNEPGYYRTGEFGIRIENLIVTGTAPAIEGADDRDMLAFETITYVPIDRRLIDVALLSNAELDWINAYHASTLARIGPLLDEKTREWLEQACAPL